MVTHDLIFKITDHCIIHFIYPGFYWMYQSTPCDNHDNAIKWNVIFPYLLNYKVHSEVKLLNSFFKGQKVITFMSDGFKKYKFIAVVDGNFCRSCTRIDC